MWNSRRWQQWGDYESSSSEDSMTHYFAIEKRFEEEKRLKQIDSIKTISNCIAVLKDSCKKNSQEDVQQLENRYSFCAVEKIVPFDITVVLDGIGKLSFPIELTTVEQMLSISESASFGSLTETLHNVNVRDTQSIPAEKIKVDFNEQALEEALSRIKSNLYLDISSGLKLHLHNMLIYGPGQFFDMHRDTEKVENMIATLVVILPSKHNGGALCVNHGYKNMKVCSSGDLDHVQLVMFYCDCQHKVKPVVDGYRVVLTYNVELEPPSNSTVCLDVDPQLNTAVLEHFSNDSNPERLVVILEHHYSEKSLKWYLLKGNDRIVAKAFLGIGKKQNYKVFLALSHNMTIFEETDYYAGFTDSTAELYYWVDENSLKIHNYEKLDKISVRKELVCLNSLNSDMADYNKTEKGWYGNGPAEKEEWYRCACVVLLAN